ncbi:TIGR02285 family protein [Bdellovibrio svalbardensis]|uniref:TIGR02285 family protein n=1 Tax=Bdellovibrio svalbardensis TaxID=2972972 RepID=A0ABT6DHP5_9BACT|nr:TIGR02285 family protein [Bdellovibrio svalbardensis]MDG0816370.1 TIGR02285 family protein [Bdellovibrio svalbardensis]
MRLLPLWIFAISVLILTSSVEVTAKALSVMVAEHANVEAGVAEPAQILWAVPNWPPFFTRDRKAPGVSNQMLQLLQSQMIDYHHENLEINTPKLVELWQQGRNICSSNILFNGEREKYGYFSPLWVYPPLHVIVREESLASFTKGAKAINVFELIKNSHFKGILIKGRSYGPPVDEIIPKLSENAFINLISPLGNWNDYLNMISNNRADYTIDYPKVVKLFNETHAGNKRLAAIPISGYEKPFIVHVACTKNPWGRAVIKELDRKIQTLAKEKSYRDLQEKLFANEPSVVQQKDIDQFILKRAKGPWFWGPMD